ncbi:large ribosomal subunit protein bL19m [Cylas formicarius]|uniref:large ribosomal subunit protein bL19m n=1 Tax=Cylas formicarius TaxID=197179 RepID=UPI002958336D|nr:large ribosomal subunit protein bL19m [Cylas formicarius]
MLSSTIKCSRWVVSLDTSKIISRFVHHASAAEKVLIKTKVEDLTKRILDYRYAYPEFLPDPNVKFRNRIREKLERIDMVTRRTQIDIPEFYVGSILAVYSADKHTPGKIQRFVGICIKRGGCGLRSFFIIRNVIDHQGVEIYYDMYDPTLHKVEVLKLEKRLDDELLYLRDALPEYSTFDVNMEAQILPDDASVPVNPIKVKLKPRPWLERWERKNLKGVQDLELPERFYIKAKKLEKPWEKYDLMKEYMRTIPEEEQVEIFSEVEAELHKLELQRKKLKRRRVIVKPTKLS